jgi:hypothetical protein
VRLYRRRHGDVPAAEEWLRYVSSYSTGRFCLPDQTSAERREKLLVNTASIFADLASGGGDVDERRLREITAPVTIVDAKLSPPFLRQSCRRLVRLLPEADRVTLENSGHGVGLDARDDLIKVIRSAIRPGGRASDEIADSGVQTGRGHGGVGHSLHRARRRRAEEPLREFDRGAGEANRTPLSVWNSLRILFGQQRALSARRWGVRSTLP